MGALLDAMVDGLVPEEEWAWRLEELGAGDVTELFGQVVGRVNDTCSHMGALREIAMVSPPSQAVSHIARLACSDLRVDVAQVITTYFRNAFSVAKFMYTEKWLYSY